MEDLTPRNLHSVELSGTPFCIKLLSFSLPFYCLLLSWCWGAASAVVTTPFPPAPPSSSVLAANTLRTRGYSLFASVLLSLSSTAANFSGTLLAPPDFAFSFATAKFLNNLRPPPRPSTSLLLYHTLKPPLILTWFTLSSRDDGDELRTLYNNNCLFLFRNVNGGEVSISSSANKNPSSAVKIRQPDIYVDDHLTVHGIDGILDPTFATKCSSFAYADPTEDNDPPKVKRSFLDHAVKALRRRGFNVVAAAMAARRSDLLSLTSVTVFAVSDRSLFSKLGGFRYDFLHHVLPTRHRFSDLLNLTVGGTEIDTLAPNKTILVHSVGYALSVDGVEVDGTEVYHNRWIVVISMKASLDDVDDSRANPPTEGTFPVANFSAPPFPGAPENGIHSEVPSPPPVNLPGNFSNGISAETPSPAAELDGGFEDYGASFALEPSPDDTVESSGSPSSPAPATATYESVDPHCDVNSSIEGGDLFCPVRNIRELRETQILRGVYMEESKPLDSFGQVSDNLTQSNDAKIVENVNVADDLFFYI